MNKSIVRDLTFRPVVALHDMRFEVTNDNKATFHDFFSQLHLSIIELSNPGGPATYKVDMQKSIAHMIDAGIPKETAVENARYGRDLVSLWAGNGWHFKNIAITMIITVQIEDGGEPIMQFLSTEGQAAVILPIETDLRDAFIEESFNKELGQAKLLLMALHVPLGSFDLQAENALAAFNDIPFLN